jgi:septum formation protein
MTGQQLILASASKARRTLLTQAGLNFTVCPATIDETALFAQLQGQGGAEDIAQALARHKALDVAVADPAAHVIGADQILVCDGRLYQKARDIKEAFANLQSLQGRTHQLVSAVCVVQGTRVLWQHIEAASLTMKKCDDEFIERYLAAVGDTALRSVGAYELEGQGSWLFERIEGDYFTILGLPLLPLLGFLQTQGRGP